LNLLDEVKIDQETFLKVSKKGLESEDKKFYEQLIACDNFLYFKNMMIKRNMQLEEEAMRLMQSKNPEKNIKLTGIYLFKLFNFFLFFIFNFLFLIFIFIIGAEYEFIKQKKYEKEIECAIQMSLAFEEEKKRLLQMEEDEIKVIIVIFIFL